MAWEERYGAIWYLELRDGESVQLERYLPDLDIVAVVIKRVDGLLSASVLRKGKADFQWRLPWWGAMEAPAIVATADDAERYFEAAVGRSAISPNFK